MERKPLLCGFNNKHYDNHILKAAYIGLTPENIKRINDQIILEGVNGWDIWLLKGEKFYIDSFDLKDDMQAGHSLKHIEGHLGMNIEESEVDFSIDRPLTDAELKSTIHYCKCDVDATEKLFHLRKNYLKNKINLGEKKGISLARSLYLTNAKLTSIYLDAVKPSKPWKDEREYTYPTQLLREYIPEEVFSFFDRLQDKTIPDQEVFTSKLSLLVGDCPCVIGFGGIHGAIPTYQEESTETRTIRNKDVASYYPNLMRKMGYCSRNIPSPQLYADTIDQRVKAKREGDKATANALKLVLNTTYGAMLNGKEGEAFNDLYDPLQGRSVCISGQ